MLQPVYLICGVPGSGKTWICKQLVAKGYLLTYIPHDEHFKNHLQIIVDKCQVSPVPVITEVPFAERELRTKLQLRGIEVIPVFVIERPDVVKARYEQREGKPCPRNNLTRAISIIERAREWGATGGTSIEVFHLLCELFEVPPPQSLPSLDSI